MLSYWLFGQAELWLPEVNLKNDCHFKNTDSSIVSSIVYLLYILFDIRSLEEIFVFY